MSIETRLTQLERRSSGTEPMIIVVGYHDANGDAAEQNAAHFRALDHARPFLKRMGQHVIVEIEDGHIRLESPSPEPLVCWCGEVHERGDAMSTRPTRQEQQLPTDDIP